MYEGMDFGLALRLEMMEMLFLWMVVLQPEVLMQIISVLEDHLLQQILEVVVQLGFHLMLVKILVLQSVEMDFEQELRNEMTIML